MTIKAHDLWNDVEVTQGTNFVCTSCKIMSIPSSSRETKRESQVHGSLEEIQVDTVPNPELIDISTDSRFNYYLILCDRYSKIFRSIGISDKSSEACIHGIEQIISNISQLKKKLPQNIMNIRSDLGPEFISDTLGKWCGENSIRFTTAAPNIKNKMIWLKDIGGQLPKWLIQCYYMQDLIRIFSIMLPNILREYMMYSL